MGVFLCGRRELYESLSKCYDDRNSPRLRQASWNGIIDYMLMGRGRDLNAMQ
jgi:hypothetical protein